MATVDQRHAALAQRLRLNGNLSALALTLLLSIVLLSALSHGRLDPGQLHALALCNAAAYLLAHGLRRLGRTALDRRSDEAARIAQPVYRSPARITDLDLAAYWSAYAVLAPAMAWPT